MTSVSKKKVRKRKSEGDALKANLPSESRSDASNWGPLEPLHRQISPIFQTCKPLFSLQSLVGLLAFLLIISFFGKSRHRSTGMHPGFVPSTFDSAQKLAAYEELWRSEEAALWEWLEARVGMGDGRAFPSDFGDGNADRSKDAESARDRVLKGAHSESRSMSEREIERAIQLTEEKLMLLKKQVRRKGKGSSEEGSPSR